MPLVHYELFKLSICWSRGKILWVYFVFKAQQGIWTLHRCTQAGLRESFQNDSPMICMLAHKTSDSYPLQASK